MLAVTADKNYSHTENILPVNESITFEPSEMKYFILEVKEMIDNNEIIDLPKAIHNAKYFAEISRRIASVEAGHWVEHDLIEDNDDE